MSERQLQ